MNFAVKKSNCSLETASSSIQTVFISNGMENSFAENVGSAQVSRTHWEVCTHVITIERSSAEKRKFFAKNLKSLLRRSLKKLNDQIRGCLHERFYALRLTPRSMCLTDESVEDKLQ